MALSVKIKKRLGNFQLDLCFDAGNELFGLLGASGCGKSLSLKCIAGIEKPDSGRIELDGRVLFDSDAGIDLSPQQRRTGYLFQQYALFPNMTVAQNIAAGIRSGGKEDKARLVKEKIEAFQLGGAENKRPHQLSGGEQQRVALARILLDEPQLIMLDEPFSALDSYLKWQLELELTDTLSAFPGTVILVSHDRDEIYRNCEHVCLLNGGSSERARETKALFADPRSMSAARLSGCKNYADISFVCGESIFEVPAWGVRLKAGRALGGEKHIGIRAHHIHIAGGDEENRLRCRVVRVIEDMFSMILMLIPENARANAPLLRMELSGEEYKTVAGAENIEICVSPDDILLLE